MVGHVGVHRADHHHVVDALGDVGEKLAHLGAAFAVLGKLKGGPERRAGGPFGFEMAAVERLPVQLGEQRLGVERVHVGRAAVCKKMDHPLGTPRKMGHPRGSTTGSRGGPHRSLGGRLERGKAEQAKTHAAALKHGAAGKRTRRVRGSVLEHFLIRFGIP